MTKQKTNQIILLFRLLDKWLKTEEKEKAKRIKVAERYESKVLTGFLTDKVHKRKVTKLARPFRIGLFIDRNINRINKLARLVLVSRGRRSR